MIQLARRFLLTLGLLMIILYLHRYARRVVDDDEMDVSKVEVVKRNMSHNTGIIDSNFTRNRSKQWLNSSVRMSRQVALNVLLASSNQTTNSFYVITNFTASVETTTWTSTEMTTTSSVPNVTYIITNISVITVSTATTLQINNTMFTKEPATSITSINPLNLGSCNDSNQIRLPNMTCLSKTDAQIYLFDLLNGNITDQTAIANALASYLSVITNMSAASNSTYILSLDKIDEIISHLDGVNLVIDTATSFIVAEKLGPFNKSPAIGAAFALGSRGRIVRAASQNNVLNSNISAAAIVSNETLINASSISMLIIDVPTAYTTLDDSMNKTLVSSIIVASVRSMIKQQFNSMNVSLYFQNILQPELDVNGNYLCSFYDPSTSKWNQSGCTTPQFNAAFQRYECTCNHLTSFALIWLPPSLLQNRTRSMNSQDIASLVFQSVSIICFLVIIVHALVMRIRDPLMTFQAYELLPLISAASTTILFVFFIALSMVVYTKTSSPDQTQCFFSSTILMFFVYFFIIFMFCTKTCIGYFNYLRFVDLFPQPTSRRLTIMLMISFVISIACVGLAAGLHSKTSLKIIQLIPYNLCWFTRDVIYYFLIIPAGVFILANLIIFVLVAKRIISHVRNATSPHQSYERMKRCVLVLLSSCFTQGIGWLFGPIISLTNPAASDVLQWFFIVFNGLEGFWLMLLYIIIRSQHIDDQKRILAAKELSRSRKSIFSIEKKTSRKQTERESDRTTKETEVKHRTTLNDATELWRD